MWRQKKKRSGPKHPWRAERIEEEHGLGKAYGIRRMREIWRMKAILRNWHRQAKEITSMRAGPKRDEVLKILLERLQRYGIVGAEADADDILSITLKDVMDKRLETAVFKKGLALTALQARQFIVHGKIMVNGKKLNSPSYLMKVGEDASYVPSFKPKLKPEEPATEVKEKPAEAKPAMEVKANG